MSTDPYEVVVPFDRIVIDTAPTGHTLRLLQLPELLNSVVGSLLKLRGKLYGAIESFKSMFGGGDENNTQQKISSTLDKLEGLQEDAERVRSALRV